jgi:hypothetical protein
VYRLSFIFKCQQQIEVLSHATWVIQMKTQNAPLCRDELRAVTVQEIEDAERALLQGCDYRLRCHHPYGAIKVLASDVTCYLKSSPEFDDGANIPGTCNASPRSVVHGFHVERHGDRFVTLCERALSIAQSALVYSDVNFLYPPGQIAFAAVALALDGHGFGTKMGKCMREYLCMKFRNKTPKELLGFEKQLGKIITHLENCSSIDLNKFSPNWHYLRDGGEVAERNASEIQRVFHTVSRLRVMARSTFQIVTPLPQMSPMQPMGYHHPHHFHHHHNYRSHHNHFHHYQHEGGRKRMREEEDMWTPLHHPHHPHPHSYKVARVTPVMMER